MTPERLRTLVTTRREFVRETPDGAAGSHGGRPYEVSILGGNLSVRRALPGLLPREVRPSLLQALNDWNRDRIIPTLHLSEHTEGFGVVATLTVSAAGGMSRDQLAQALDLGVTLGAAALEAAAVALGSAGDQAP